MGCLQRLLVINYIQYTRFFSSQKRHHIIKFYSKDKMSGKTALIVLSPGSEEMEFTISADVLRRAGINVTLAGLCGTEPVKCSRDVVIKPDVSLESVKIKKYDVVVMPGGLSGSKAMSDSTLLGDILKEHESDNRLIAAICAAPLALAAHNIGYGKTITSYPSIKSRLEKLYCYKDDANTLAVCDNNLITSRGPGTAFHFALIIVENLCGLDKAKEVAKAMLFNYK